MSVTIYQYANCSTCKKALKFLDGHKVQYIKRAIVETPPNLDELKKALAYLQASGKTIKNLFNVSGQLYREMNMAEKFQQYLNEKNGEARLLKLLSENGKLIKRPFLITETQCLLGFQEDEWKKALKA